MKNLTTLQRKPVTTFREMKAAMYPIEGSESRGFQTITGQFKLNGETVTIYHHWSTEGYQVYSDSTLTNRIAEVRLGPWYPWFDENGNQRTTEIGLLLFDCEISFEYVNQEVCTLYEN